MTPHNKAGATIALLTSLVAATGIIAGYLRVPIAVGVAMVGIVIGTALARGMFSRPPHANKKKL